MSAKLAEERKINSLTRLVELDVLPYSRRSKPYKARGETSCKLPANSKLADKRFESTLSLIDLSNIQVIPAKKVFWIPTHLTCKNVGTLVDTIWLSYGTKFNNKVMLVLS